MQLGGVRNMRKVSVKGWAMTAAIAVGVTVIGAHVASGDQSTPIADTSASSRVTAAIGSPRVATLEEIGKTAVATGAANKGDQADMVRTEWYETLAAAALAQTDGLTTVRRDVLDDSGSNLYSEIDPFSSEQTGDAFASPSLTESDIRTALKTQAEAAGVAVVDVHYVDLFGGAAELVLQPSDLNETLHSASTVTNALLGSLGNNQHPYLITIVNSQGEVQMLQGYMPGVGGDKGQGLGWLAPGLQTDNFYGAPLAADNGN